MFRKPNSEVRMKPEFDKVKLCKNCKHFVPPSKNVDIKYGNCALFGSIHVVDGSIEYLAATVARDFYCKDAYYDSNNIVN